MIRRHTIIFLIAGVAFIGSCGVVRTGGEVTQTNSGRPLMASVSDGDASENSVIKQLYSAHTRWEGTPYILGGSGQNGVDCSSFTQIVFNQYFDEGLPRNTREQLQEGVAVRRNQIRPGDLIFFRTSRSTLHVGIAVEDGQFLHASVSNGVTISNLSDRYWAGRYLGARRVL